MANLLKSLLCYSLLISSSVSASVIQFDEIDDSRICDIPSVIDAGNCDGKYTSRIDDEYGAGFNHVLKFTVLQDGPVVFSLNGTDFNFPHGLWMAEPLPWYLKTYDGVSTVSSGFDWVRKEIIVETTREGYSEADVSYTVLQDLTPGRYKFITWERGGYRETLADSVSISGIPLPPAIVLFCSAFIGILGGTRFLRGHDPVYK